MTQWNFKAGKSTSKTEVCSKSADPHPTMHWIKEVEMAMSIGRTHDIAIDCGAKGFPRLRYACIEKNFRQSCSIPQKSMCRRAACSKKKKTTDSYEGNKLHT